MVDPRRPVDAGALKMVKVHLNVPATADIATTKQDLTNVGRLFERVITQEAQVILEVQYSPAWAKDHEDNPEEALRQELRTSFEALKERLLRAIDGSPPRAADVRMEFVKDNPSDEKDGGGHGGRIRDRWHGIVSMHVPHLSPRVPRQSCSCILVLHSDTDAVISRYRSNTKLLYLLLVIDVYSISKCKTGGSQPQPSLPGVLVQRRHTREDDPILRDQCWS